MNSYKADPDNENAVEPRDTLADKGGSPEDAMFAEPETENPQTVEARRVIDEKCTESQQDFFFKHSGEGEIRRKIIEADFVDCVAALPAQLFYTTQIPASLWFLGKKRKQSGKTLFIDARKMRTMITRKLRELTDGSTDTSDNDIGKIADTYKAFAEGNMQNVS